ncbi:hypothetical protein JZ968_06810 [Riemerella anatipestifer]
MALLKIKAKAKVMIVWGEANIIFTRSLYITKDLSIAYSGAVGQSFSARQLLYTQGNRDDDGYIAVRSKETTTLNGNGTLNITIEHRPSSTEGNKTLVFNVDESPMRINLYYNSQPNIRDVIVETNNRTTYTFTETDFTSQYTDYDNDPIAQVQINGDVTGYQFNGSPYVEGTWISISDIRNGALKYTPLNQSEAYEKDNTWKAKDSQGYISIN